MIGFAFWGIGAGYLAQEHPAVAVLSSLLIGFAPLIGLFVLLIIVALLISFLICTFERILTDEDADIVSEPHLKSKWHRVALSLPDLLTHYLWLKEHSPPVIHIPDMNCFMSGIHPLGSLAF